MKCAGCLVWLKSEVSGELTAAISSNLDPSGPSYPSLEFVDLLHKLEEAARTLLQMQKPLSWFVNRPTSVIIANPPFAWKNDRSVTHRMELAKLNQKKVWKVIPD